MLIVILFLLLQTPAAPSGLAAIVDPGSMPYTIYVTGCESKGLTPFSEDSYYSYGFDVARHQYCLAPSASPDFDGQMDWK